MMIAFAPLVTIDWIWACWSGTGLPALAYWMSALKPASSIDFSNAAPARTQFCEVLAGSATPIRAPFSILTFDAPSDDEPEPVSLPRAEQPLRARPATSARPMPAMSFLRMRLLSLR